MSVSTPQRVAFETPRGTVVSGRVQESWLEASAAAGPQTMLRVAVDGRTYRVPAAEATDPTSD